ncbi:hypothetical protein I4U23_005756 [Adineta vaga]|nr:hypothetical protein I4U23_005756 [Adineta vaga]
MLLPTNEGSNLFVCKSLIDGYATLDLYLNNEHQTLGKCLNQRCSPRFRMCRCRAAQIDKSYIGFPIFYHGIMGSAAVGISGLNSVG